MTVMEIAPTRKLVVTPVIPAGEFKSAFVPLVQEPDADLPLGNDVIGIVSPDSSLDGLGSFAREFCSICPGLPSGEREGGFDSAAREIKVVVQEGQGLPAIICRPVTDKRRLCSTMAGFSISRFF